MTAAIKTLQEEEEEEEEEASKSGRNFNVKDEREDDGEEETGFVQKTTTISQKMSGDFVMIS